MKKHQTEDVDQAGAIAALRGYGPDDERVVLRARRSWGGSIVMAVVIGWLPFLFGYIYYSKPSAIVLWGSPLLGFIVMELFFLSVLAFIPGIALRFRVIIDRTHLSYRFFFFWHKILLENIEVVDKNCEGISLGPSNQLAYTKSLFVHPKPGSGAKGFRINYPPMDEYDVWVMYKKLEPYMGKGKGPPRWRKGRQRWIPISLWKG